METDTVFTSALEQVPDGLYERVMGRVQRARIRSARIHAAISLFFISASSAGSFFAARSAAEAASASGFTSFASLALTDTSVIALHAQTFALSLIETLPSVQVAGVLLGISVLLVSLRSLVHALSHIPAPGSSARSLTTHA